MFLGVEIGGTKLQLALGAGDGVLRRVWRGTVDPAAGAAGVLAGVERGYAELLAAAGVGAGAVRGAGVGFGGPVDAAAGRVLVSHQVCGWADFPLADWARDALKLPAAVLNDADAAGLGEALFGAGRGLSPLFYVTAGSGVGGALVVDGTVYAGAGRGAAEVGHLPVTVAGEAGTVESFASGWAVSRRAGRSSGEATVAAARAGDARALAAIDAAAEALATGLAAVVLLVCPRRIVIGGGVSHFGDDLLFAPLREKLAARTFPPFAGLTDVVPAELGELVVPHGTLALARRAFGKGAS